MERTYWHKQEQNKPLFPDLLWSRPENRKHAGKLLIVGGNVHSFAAVAEAYQYATKAGAGAIRVLMPDALRKTVGPLLDNVDYAPSTPSGSFNQKALAEALELASWADGVLLAGDFGRNSETAILIEKFIQKTELPMVATKDAADYLVQIPDALLTRKNITLVLTITELQHLASSAHYPKAFTFDMGLLKLVETLHDFTEEFPVNIVLKHLDTTFVATSGYVSTTAAGDDQDMWRVKTAAYASVWWLQNPSKVFESLTTAAFETAGGRGGT